MGNDVLKGATAIAGLGATEFSKHSGRTEMQLAVEAVKDALDDAGIHPSEIDGMSSYSMDNNPEIEIFRLLGGKLPVNTHGGQLGEAYIHGLNGVAEGVRQVRGRAANQVDNVEHVLVTAGAGVPTSGLILGAS